MRPLDHPEPDPPDQGDRGWRTSGAPASDPSSSAPTRFSSPQHRANWLAGAPVAIDVPPVEPTYRDQLLDYARENEGVGRDNRLLAATLLGVPTKEHLRPWYRAAKALVDELLPKLADSSVAEALAGLGDGTVTLSDATCMTISIYAGSAGGQEVRAEARLEALLSDETFERVQDIGRRQEKPIIEPDPPTL